MQKLEEYVNATPANEEKLAELMRDHSISLKNYQSLLEKRLHAKISENLEKKQQSEQFRILDPANFPTEPTRPNRLLIVGMGGALGGGLGIGLILLLNYLNPAIGKSEDIYGMFGIPVLATIPRYHTDFGKDHRLIVLQESDSFIAEQYRILYTKINDLSKGNIHKILAITSAVPNEGKTVTALNLAVVMAKDCGKRTLVLEGDFRRPNIPLYLNVDLEEGLVDILSSKSNFQSTMVPVANTLVPFADDNLAVLPAVRRTQSSTSLLSSPRMRELFDVLREQYDFILIDSPPILPLSDMNIFEEVVDGIIMIIRAESTTRDTVTKALETLGTDKVLGIVLNDVSRAPFAYHRYHYKYDYKPDTN
jgi:capsular exopolysaccharide synthesis family protein